MTSVRRAGTGQTGYDVSLDGARFLRVQQTRPDGGIDRIELVLHWDEELRRLAPPP